MPNMETTEYFEQKAKFNHPEISEEWVTRVISDPFHTEIQPDGRIRYYGYIEEAGKWVRVNLEDGKLFNRFFDRMALRRWGQP